MHPDGVGAARTRGGAAHGRLRADMPFQTTIPTLPAPDHRLPPKLEGLTRLAYNMYWSWHPEVRSLFARIDRRVWLSYRSPVAVLRAQRDWTYLLDDPDFMVQYQTILRDFDAYMANGREHWFAREHGGEIDGPVAYFCAEYGLQESLPIYSGGLGVLAGDHCKTASDMALPFVAVGLFSRRGYFRQSIDADGHQEHNYFNLQPEPTLSQILGFDDVIMLGYRDSGMPDTPPNEHPDAFINADADEVLARTVMPDPLPAGPAAVPVLGAPCIGLSRAPLALARQGAPQRRCARLRARRRTSNHWVERHSPQATLTACQATGNRDSSGLPGINPLFEQHVYSIGDSINRQNRKGSIVAWCVSKVRQQ